MVMRRLSSVGMLEVVDTSNPPTEIPPYLDRKIRLVYEGQFDSMEGPVTVTRQHLEQLAKKHNAGLSKLRRLATGEIPLASNPSIQLDHSRSAINTVGRLHGNLELEEFDHPEHGRVLSLTSMSRILGRDNVERVLDGRWSEVSIGADFDNSKLEEVSFTPFPAAKGSSLLSRLRAGERVFEDSNGGKWKVTVEGDPVTGLFEAKIEGRSIGKFQTEDTAQQKAEEELNEIFKKSVTLGSAKVKLFKQLEARLRTYFKLKKNMSDKDCDDKMKKLEEEESEEELTKLAKEMDDDEAEEKKKEEEKKAEKLTATKTKITQLTSDFRSSAERTRLAAKSASITHRLSALRSSGKITPAEIKKINVEELAGKSDEAIATLMKSYEDRQPVIMTGVFGSMKALSHAELQNMSKTKRLRALELERLQNMPSFTSHLSAEQKAQLQKEYEDAAADEVNIHIDTDPHTDLGAMETEYNDVCKMMDDGKIDEAKKVLKGWMGRMGAKGDYANPEPTMHEISGSKLTSLQDEIVKLQQGFDEAMGLLESLATGT